MEWVLNLCLFDFCYARKMKTIMNVDKLTTITELEQFLDGSQAVAFSILDDKQSKYSFIKKTLVKFHCAYGIVNLSISHQIVR